MLVCVTSKVSPIGLHLEASVVLQMTPPTVSQEFLEPSPVDVLVSCKTSRSGYSIGFYSPASSVPQTFFIYIDELRNA
jgi:hypothetical protein